MPRLNLQAAGHQGDLEEVVDLHTPVNEEEERKKELRADLLRSGHKKLRNAVKRIMRTKSELSIESFRNKWAKMCDD